MTKFPFSIQLGFWALSWDAGIYIAVVVSDNYGAVAFVIGCIIIALGFFIAVFSADLVRHLATLDRRHEDGFPSVTISKLEPQNRNWDDAPAHADAP